MGRRNTGSWKELQGLTVPPPADDPFLFGLLEVNAANHVVTHLCERCAAQRGVTADTPGWYECRDIDDVARYEHCGDCGASFLRMLPLRCPRCGQGQCFTALALALVHVGPTYAPHGEPVLCEEWDDVPEAQLGCTRCDWWGDLDEALPPLPRWDGAA